MRNLKFKYARAKNFLCFGPEGIEINFESYGNIVCIKGKNLDVNNEDGNNASNGSGKSSIPEIIVYALFGKTVKKPKKLNHTDVINNSAELLEVELLWDDFRVLRTRDSKNKGTLRFWQSEKGEWNKDTELSEGGIPSTQKALEKKLGLTYESFINIFIFSDDNTLPFLECESPVKRVIVENILSLEKYRNYYETANTKLKELKTKIKELVKEYELLGNQKESATLRIAQIERQEKDWFDVKKKELDNVLREIKKKVDELEKSKTGAALIAYQLAQEEIAILNSNISILEESKVTTGDYIKGLVDKEDKVVTMLLDCDKNVISIQSRYDEYETLINRNKKIVDDISLKTGKECPYCFNLVEESNFASILKKAKSVLEEKSPEFEEIKTSFEEAKNKKIHIKNIKDKLTNEIAKHKLKLNGIEKELSETHLEISKLSKVQKPNTDIAELLLGEQIESLKKQSIEKQDELKGSTPFEAIKRTATVELIQKVNECNAKDAEVKKNEADVPYYDFFVKAFGDTGIRKYVIDGIIPTLNSRIEYWLQFLIDNKIKLTFNNELEETIDRYPFNGRPYVYHGMSGGQRRRLSLTVAAAWAYVSTLNSGASPSAIFLDEVTMNMDAVGVQGIYRMICELAKEKQVFVIDHNDCLLEMLNGCDVIHLEMKDEISTKVLDSVEVSC